MKLEDSMSLRYDVPSMSKGPAPYDIKPQLTPGADGVDQQ